MSMLMYMSRNLTFEAVSSMVEFFFNTARAAARSSLSWGSFSSCWRLAAWDISEEALRPNALMFSISSPWDDAFFTLFKSSSTYNEQQNLIIVQGEWVFMLYEIHTTLSDFKRRWTSTISARIRRRVTAERRFLAARTILPRFKDEQGSSANSRAATLIAAPFKAK